jgi:hypothetical protein
VIVFTYIIIIDTARRLLLSTTDFFAWLLLAQSVGGGGRVDKNGAERVLEGQRISGQGWLQRTRVNLMTSDLNNTFQTSTECELAISSFRYVY